MCLVQLQFTNLTHLEDLGISNNRLVGSLPSNLGQFTKLRSMRLHRNSISGTLPASVANFTLLEELHVSQNLLVGYFPSDLHRLTELQVFKLNNNSVSGNIVPLSGSTSVTTCSVVMYHHRMDICGS